MIASVLVVCVGNICRSPVGERALAAAAPHLRIASAGLSALVGNPADALAAEAAAAQGIDLGGHVAQQLTADLGVRYDLILVMERDHRREIAAQMPQLSGRTMLFGHWLEGGTDVPDPYGRQREVHEATVALIRRAADTWCLRLEKMR